MTKDYYIVVLISGRGSNLLSLISNANNYTISAVISNNQTAKGLTYAQDHGIPAFAFDRKDYSDLTKQKEAIFKKIDELKPNLVVLAGFMLMITPQFVERYRNRLINIHPALLPNFPGLDTHQRAINSQCQEHGCTVHYVDEGVDTGTIIAQAACPVLKDDNAETLSARVLKLEHRLYPWVTNGIACGDIWLEKQSTQYSKRAIDSAIELGFRIQKL